MQLTADLSQLDPAIRQAVIRKLAHEDRARYDLGLIEQRRIKQLHDTATVGTYKSEIGPAQMVLSQDQWARAMQKYGQFCFMDPDFAPWLLRNNDDMRVRQCATKIQVGYTGSTHA